MNKSFLAIAAIALTAVGCTKTEIVNSQTENNPINFKTYANVTKGASAVSSGTSNDVTDNATLQAGSFGVVGYTGNAIYLGAEATTASASAAIQQSYSASAWNYATASELKFWPATGTMDFYAYYPYNANTTVKIAAANGSSTTPLEICGWTDKTDVLYATALTKSYEATTALQFNHAFAKIKQVTIKKAGDVATSGINVNVSAIEIQGTATTGSIKISETGAVTYANPSTARAITGLTVNVEDASQNLISEGSNAYVFPTGNSTGVTGTGAAMWDGSAATNVVDGKVCLKITGKVYQGDTYYVGTSSSDGVFYIPMCTSSVVDPATVTSLVAGKRYTYNIVMSNNVGYNENGVAILRPIKFSASVTSWADESAVTITL